MAKYKKALYIFRRDLRIDDNTGLINALKTSKEVIPLFVFDERQRGHEYFSNNAFEFMLNSLDELEKELQKKGAELVVLEGNLELILKDLKELEDIDAIFINSDYTPFSKVRDAQIRNICEKLDISLIENHDYLLNPPGSVLNAQGEPYKVATAFQNKAMTIDVEKPRSNKYTNYAKSKINKKAKIGVREKNPHIMVRGGRVEGLKLMREIENKKDYDTNRDFVFEDATTKLSAHLKFGTISVRELYWHLRAKFYFAHPLIKQLYWRDFFTHIAYFYPKVFKESFREEFKNIEWWGKKDELDAWMQGKTGFPIVDAAMRQINKTGWMHGRARMIVGSFLVKNLGINWRLGEKYFAQKLVDYDPCLNNGNWQWVASTGCDAQPFFRIFNPQLQQKKFDKDCKYIKKWLPELENTSNFEIHNFLNKPLSYAKPIINYKDSIIKAKNEFKKAFEKHKKNTHEA